MRTLLLNMFEFAAGIIYLVAIFFLVSAAAYAVFILVPRLAVRAVSSTIVRIRSLTMWVRENSGKLAVFTMPAAGGAALGMLFGYSQAGNVRFYGFVYWLTYASIADLVSFATLGAVSGVAIAYVALRR